jgi:predicted nicotinamide N-methyase
MSSYQCSDCNEVVSDSRKAQHEKFWCPSIPPSSDDLVLDDEPTPLPLPDQAFHNHQLHKITSVTLSTGLQLSFEERSIFSRTSTGGALWKSELLLAEYVLHNCSPRQRVLELGCGAAPCAGLAAASINCNILMTDISDVCSLAEVNLRRNAAAVQEARGGGVSLGRDEYDTCVLDWGAAALPQRVQDLLPFSFIICGDCIWASATHEMLAASIARLLDASTRCAIAFQRRSDEEEHFFQSVCPRHGLMRVAVEQEELIKKLPCSKGSNPKTEHAGLEICELILKSNKNDDVR